MPSDELPDQWIQDFYEHGFFVNNTGQKITRKNAGEVSIITLAFCLLHHFKTQISNVVLASTDFGIIKMKNKVLQGFRNSPFTTTWSADVPISFFSINVTLHYALKNGHIDIGDIPTLRPNPISTMFIKHHASQTASYYDYVLHTADFIEMCRTPHQYTFIF